jgi:hypothetical protein
MPGIRKGSGRNSCGSASIKRGHIKSASAQFKSDCPKGVLGRRALTRKTVSSKLPASASGRHA